ncbi:MAG: hypothetical protein IMHGJWDQ_002216 [Candidatus Fervidibacter sp.]
MGESARQQRVRYEGERWEVYVTQFLRRHLSDKGYEVYRGGELPRPLRQQLSLNVPSIWGTVDLKAIGDTAPIFGDVDILVAKNGNPVLIVSCKLSLHNRLTETLFWSMLYQQAGIRVVLVTPDKGQGNRSEWGGES